MGVKITELDTTTVNDEDYIPVANATDGTRKVLMEDVLASANPTIDTALDTTSTNAVTNAAVATAIAANTASITENASDIATLSEDVDDLTVDVNAGIVKVETTESSTSFSDVTPTFTNGYVGTNGTVVDGSTSLQYTQKISVSEGDVISLVAANATPMFRFICAYSGESAVSSAGVISSTDDYTVPEGIDGVIITVYVNQGVTAIRITTAATATITKYYPLNQGLGKINWTGSLSDGDSVSLIPTNVRFNTVWTFTGLVSTMGKVTIGILPLSGSLIELASIDDTYVYYRSNVSGDIATEAHGLTIADDLQIRIESAYGINTLKSIKVCSGGTEYTLSATCYGKDMTGYPCLVSDGAELVNCAFAWIPQDIDKPIWIFGDSWASMYTSRWPYYMVEAGYTNTWMINAYAGEPSASALVSLKNLLTIRKPEMIVWMPGMNDGDTSDAVNTSWNECYEELVEICTAYKIELILYTVPNTPSITHVYKNAIIEASGYRYIDGVAAMGDDGEGNWLEGYTQSSTNLNHTSALGARALFYRMIADVPELAGNGY